MKQHLTLPLARFTFDRRLAIGLLATALLIGMLSLAIILWGGSGGSTGALKTPRGDLEFPVGLALDAPPSDIAIDGNGTLWAIWGSGTEQLVLYDAPAGSVAPTRHVLDRDFRYYGASVDIADDGDVIVAAGMEVRRIDPLTFESQSFRLPRLDLPAAFYPPGAPSNITQLHVQGRQAFITRFGSSDITRLDVETGEFSDIAVPYSFRSFDDFILDANLIWLLKTANPGSQIGLLNVETGALDVVPVKVRSADLFGDGIIAVTWDPDSIVRVDRAGNVTPVDAGSIEDEFFGKLGVDSTTVGKSGVWIAETTAQAIVWLDPETGASASFVLPTMEVAAAGCPAGADCDGPFFVQTEVAGTALSPEGDFYFGDATQNRVGVISVD